MFMGKSDNFATELLKPFKLRIIAVSAYLSKQPELAKTIGIDKLVSIEDAFSKAYVISNHLPDRASNKNVLKKAHFASMCQGATFINTGRGTQVDEDSMIRVLKSRPDLTALLDVQHPEPPEAGSELYCDEEDEQELSWREKDDSIEKRWRRLLRISAEAREQDGLLTQEDLAKILMCDVRTIRRDIVDQRKADIVVPTRGTIKDIGTGVSHRALAIRLWLEGKEPSEVVSRIKHSLKVTENYLEKFRRVAYLKCKGFSKFEIIRTIGISVSATKTFLEIYIEFKSKAFFKSRMNEIELVGALHYQAQDEKKEFPTSKISTSERQVKQ